MDLSAQLASKTSSESTSAGAQGELDSLVTGVQPALDEPFVRNGMSQESSSNIDDRSYAVYVNPEHTREPIDALMMRSRMLHAQYQITWRPEDVESRIQALRDASAILLLAAQDPGMNSGADLATCRFELSIALGDRYKHQGYPEDLEEQLQLLQLALNTSLVDSNSAALIQRELGVAFRAQFSRSGDANDILEAYKLHSSVLDQHPDGHPDRGWSLYELAETLFDRFRKLGNGDDIGSCIAFHKEALELIPASDPCRCVVQSSLADALWMSHLRGSDISYLHEATAIHRDVLQNQPSNHRDRYRTHGGLGVCLTLLFEQTGDIQQLSEAVECHRRAVDLHLHRVGTIMRLASSLRLRFNYLGDIEDLQESIRLLRSCLDVPHALHGGVLSELALALKSHYAVLGASDDLDECIGLLRESLQIHPPGNPRRHVVLNNLGNALCCRYERNKKLEDNTEAIVLYRETAALGSQGSNADARSILSLAGALRRNYEDTSHMKYLEEAIELCEAWLTCSESAVQNLRGGFLYQYAHAIALRYNCYRRMDDLCAAISSYKEALDCDSAGDIERYLSLIGLADVLCQRFEVSHAQDDAENSMELLIEALACLPDGHPDHARSLFKLAELYLLKASPFFSIHTALKMLVSAVFKSHQNVQVRLASAMDVLKDLEFHASRSPHAFPFRQELLNAYTLTINLLPRAAYFGLDVKSRLRSLTNSDKLAIDGAANALLLGQPQVALELLEQGRAVFWSQHLRLRTAFSMLPSDLGAKLTKTATMLEIGSHAMTTKQGVADSDGSAKAAQENEAAKQRRLGEDFEALVREARALPGFERFMLPEMFQVLTTAAIRIPIVVLLANEVTCQAIVIQGPGSAYQLLLPDVSLQRLQTLSQLMGKAIRRGRDLLQGRAMKRIMEKGGRSVEEVLAELWRKILSRIVDALQLKKAKGRDRPRLTLCPTGIFVHLPLHAAGLYCSGDSTEAECLSDYVVTSYTPTIGALLKARQPPILSTTAVKMLLVAVSQPSKWAKLPLAVDEVKIVRAMTPLHISVDILGDFDVADSKTDIAPTTDAVLNKLPEAAILHLACHGHQDPHNPLESGFVMQDKMLTVAMLMSLNLTKAFLAFLSACETAKGDRAQPDQAIHLAATMLFAGFRSVLATMWSMDDFDGPTVAKTVYKEIFKDGAQVVDPDAVPYALDLATRKLREKGLAAARWAPFVHLGM